MIVNVRGTNGCLVGATLIDCPRDLKLHPRGVPIRDLVGKRFQTYSWDDSSDTMVLSPVNRVWCSGRKPVYRVTFTAYATRNTIKMRDGTVGVGRYLAPCELTGTYDHLVMLSDGSWRKLGELRKGDSLKSFYRRHADRGKISWSTAVERQVSVGGRRPFTYFGRTEAVSEQQFVCRAVNGPRPEGFDAHHKDENAYNHTPSNLEWKDSSKHKSDHLRDANLRRKNGWQKTGNHPRGMLGKCHSDETLQKMSVGSARVHRERRERALNHRVVTTPRFVGYQLTYDMEVERTANFVANGVVVHNSGKSTIIKAFLQRFPHVELFGALGSRRPEAYKVRVTGAWFYIVGPYQSLTGGIDAVPLSSPQIVELLEKYRKLGHVVFEGVVISTYHGAIGEWLVQHRDEARVVYLDTPLSACLQGLEARRSTSRGTKNVEAKIKMIERTRLRFEEVGVPTFVMPREDAVERIKGWLGGRDAR